MKPPSPAAAVAGLARIVALSGTGYAVTRLPADSAGTARLGKSAVTGGEDQGPQHRAA